MSNSNRAKIRRSKRSKLSKVGRDRLSGHSSGNHPGLNREGLASRGSTNPLNPVAEEIRFPLPERKEIT